MRVFLSYRRDDFKGHANLFVRQIYDRLVQRFDAGNVFWDLDSIPQGVPFASHIATHMAKSQVFLVVIGPDWAEIFRQRAGLAEDHVRIEIETALLLGLRVIPILADGVPVPRAEDLPESIRVVLGLNVCQVDPDRNFGVDVARLIRTIEQPSGESGDGPSTEVIQAEDGPHGLSFGWCPPGSFQMGSPAEEENRGADETLHEVTLTQGFWIARHPVTQKQWQSLMGDNPAYFKKAGLDAPVESVNWEDAVRFCRRLTERDADWCYQLPTEAQWEYACRAGTTGPYNAPGAVVDLMWYEGNSGKTTHPVGEKRPNGWGLHDMHGNVWEWCADWLSAYPAGTVNDPTGPSMGEARVLRGGSVHFGARLCRSAYRSGYFPVNRFDDFGFRPVRVEKA